LKGSKCPLIVTVANALRSYGRRIGIQEVLSFALALNQKQRGGRRMGRLVKGRSFYKEPWYNSYRCMKSRCYREKDPSYKYYGGRGIEVCDEWMDI